MIPIELHMDRDMVLSSVPVMCLCPPFITFLRVLVIFSLTFNKTIYKPCLAVPLHEPAVGFISGSVTV
jgi:hypothetical protein